MLRDRKIIVEKRGRDVHHYRRVKTTCDPRSGRDQPRELRLVSKHLLGKDGENNHLGKSLCPECTTFELTDYVPKIHTT